MELDATMADAGEGQEEEQGPKELPAIKVTFYELLLRQLQDDGFTAEAQSIASRLNLQPNEKVEKNALVESYAKSLKWAFGDEPQGAWKPITCSPVPILGPQEKVLDFDPSSMAARGSDQQRKAPEVKSLYAASLKSACRAVSFSTDGRLCAAGCFDGSIKLLDTARMKVCSASTDGPLGRMRVTDEELSKPLVRTLQDHVSRVSCLAFHPANPTLFSGSLDKTVKIYDLTRPPGHKKAFSFLQDVHPIRSMSIHPCGDFLYVGTAHQVVRLYDLQTLNCFTTFNQDDHHLAGINDIQCTSDGRVFATAGSDGEIKLWDAVSYRILNRLPKAHSGCAVTTLRWSRGLRYLLTSGLDGRHRLWDVRLGREVFCMGFGPRSCEHSTAVFVSGEKYIAAATSNFSAADMTLYDALQGSSVIQKLGQHNMVVHALDSSPVDRTIITGSEDEKSRFFSIEDKA